MVIVARRIVLMGLAVAIGMTASRAFADDAAEARKVVEGFITAAQDGDEKGVKGAVVTATEHEGSVAAYLDLMVATSQLKKAATTKFGKTAETSFGAAAGPAVEARLKAVREAPVKMAGESVLLTIPDDEANKQAGATFILKKSGGAWKLDGASLFHLTTESKEKTERNVALSKKLLEVTRQMIQEINDGKYAAAVDAFQEFWSRSSKAAKELDARAVEGAATQKG